MNQPTEVPPLDQSRAFDAATYFELQLTQVVDIYEQLGADRRWCAICRTEAQKLSLVMAKMMVTLPDDLPSHMEMSELSALLDKLRSLGTPAPAAPATTVEAPPSEASL